MDPDPHQNVKDPQHTGGQEVNTNYTLKTKSNANFFHDHLSVLRNRTRNHFLTLDPDPD